MVNAKPLVAQALISDFSLISLIPKERMFDGVASFQGNPIFPYLTYEELANVEGLNADDEEVESEITFRVHLWGTSSLSILAGHVDRILRTLDMGRNYSMDSDEVLNNQVIKHKIMSFTGVFSN